MMQNALVRKTITDLGNVFYPSVCLLCHERIASQEFWLCGKCRDSLNELSKPICNKCGYPLITDECPECAENHYVFTQARAVFAYDNAAKALVHALKYRGFTKLGDWFANQIFLSEQGNNYLQEIDCVTAIPLHRVRKRERGFNQSELIAQGLAFRLNKPYFPNLIIRKNYTVSQTTLTGKQRRKNLEGAFFSGKKSAEGLKVLLVDDVFTTGSTVNEATKVLLQKGAKDVYVLTACRGL
ncbi:MAG TPA: ComF family protein [Candidatus Cloacimonadota bacterium]|nr:ComF family protein [Candidatus Cloacimonadota bacterium]